MSQAIQTIYMGATTKHPGGRVRAVASAGRLSIEWDDALTLERNHKAAALAFALKWGWSGPWHGGQLPNGDFVWVRAEYGIAAGGYGFTVLELTDLEMRDGVRYVQG